MNNPVICKVVTLYFTDAVSIETDEQSELVFGMEAGRFVVCVRACVRACVCVCVCHDATWELDRTCSNHRVPGHSNYYLRIFL